SGASASNAGQATPNSTRAGSAASTPPMPTRYTLSGTAAGFDLSAHLNHQIEITGQSMNSATATSGRTGAANQTDAREKAGPRVGQADDLPTLTIRSGRMLANRCS